MTNENWQMEMEVLLSITSIFHFLFAIFHLSFSKFLTTSARRRKLVAA